jgi:hypothetical protein
VSQASWENDSYRTTDQGQINNASSSVPLTQLAENKNGSNDNNLYQNSPTVKQENSLIPSKMQT